MTIQEYLGRPLGAYQTGGWCEGGLIAGAVPIGLTLLGAGLSAVPGGQVAGPAVAGTGLRMTAAQLARTVGPKLAEFGSKMLPATRLGFAGQVAGGAAVGGLGGAAGVITENAFLNEGMSPEQARAMGEAVEFTANLGLPLASAKGVQALLSVGSPTYRKMAQIYTAFTTKTAAQTPNVTNTGSVIANAATDEARALIQNPSRNGLPQHELFAALRQVADDYIAVAEKQATAFQTQAAQDAQKLVADAHAALAQAKANAAAAAQAKRTKALSGLPSDPQILLKEQAAVNAAQKRLNAAQLESQRIIAEGRKNADAVKADAADRKRRLDAQTSGRAAKSGEILEKSKTELGKIGDTSLDAADIGKPLEEAATTRFNSLQESTSS